MDLDLRVIMILNFCDEEDEVTCILGGTASVPGQRKEA